MATFSRPAKLPVWADTSLNIITVPDPKRDEGWLFEEIHPSGFENYKENLNGNWWKWVGERLDDGTTDDILSVWGNIHLETTGDASFEGGVQVGFGDGTTAVAGELHIGDTAARQLLSGDSFFLYGDADDYLQFERTQNRWTFFIGGNIHLRIDDVGVLDNSRNNTDEVFIRSGGVSGARDNVTDPGNDGYRMGYAGSTTTALVAGNTPVGIGNELLLIEKTDDTAAVDGAIVFATTPNTGVIQPRLMILGGGNVVPGQDGTQFLGNSVARWAEIWCNDLVFDSTDVFDYNSASDTFQFKTGGTIRARIDGPDETISCRRLLGTGSDAVPANDRHEIVRGNTVAARAKVSTGGSLQSGHWNVNTVTGTGNPWIINLDTPVANIATASVHVTVNDPSGTDVYLAKASMNTTSAAIVTIYIWNDGTDTWDLSDAPFSIAIYG